MSAEVAAVEPGNSLGEDEYPQDLNGGGSDDDGDLFGDEEDEPTDQNAYDSAPSTTGICS
jgi:hypothetical protein